MPCWTCEPGADQRIKLVITGFKNGLYKSREDTAKSHGVDTNTLRRRLNGKHKSHKSRIFNGGDYYPLQNLQLCDSVYTLENAA
jgi:hypothetical protein